MMMSTKQYGVHWDGIRRQIIWKHSVTMAVISSIMIMQMILRRECFIWNAIGEALYLPIQECILHLCCFRTWREMRCRLSGLTGDFKWLCLGRIMMPTTDRKSVV